MENYILIPAILKIEMDWCGINGLKKNIWKQTGKFR